MATINPLVLTFNCGREPAKPDVFARHLVQSLPQIPSPEIIVLSLQEVAPVAYAFLGGSFLSYYLNRFHQAVDIAAGKWSEDGDKRYISLVTRNVGMTAIMVFVRANRVDRVKWIETGGAGVGFYETGNKGCVGVRLGYAVGAAEEMELTFLAAHLAPMEDKLQKRNQDWKDVVQCLVFTPVDGKKTRRATRSGIARFGDEEPLLPEPEDNGSESSSGIYTSTSYLFLAGDLNYRTSITKPQPADQAEFPQPVAKSDPQHFTNLLKHDQLLPEIKAEHTAHGLSEFPITFPPTYKYSDEASEAAGVREAAVAKAGSEDTPDGSSDLKQWDWAVHRWPSWCDRILYLDLPPWMKEAGPGRAIDVNAYTSLPLMSTSDHQPVALSLSVPLKAIPPPEDASVDDYRITPPYSIDPNWQSRRAVARRREIWMGMVSYVTITWEGKAALLATVVGAMGGWFVVRSMLQE